MTTYQFLCLSQIFSNILSRKGIRPDSSLAGLMSQIMALADGEEIIVKSYQVVGL